MQNRFRAIISLGGRCQVAHQLHRIFPHSDIAFPLDWLITSNLGLLRLLACRFEDVISEELLIEADTNRPEFHHKHVLNKKHETLISHDFSNVMPISEGILRVREKYDFLTKRWQNTLQSGDPVLLVRQSYGPTDAVALDRDDVANIELAVEIRQAVLAAWPDANVSVLCRSHVPRAEVNDPAKRVSCQTLLQPPIWDWKGSDCEWDDAMRPFSLADG